MDSKQPVSIQELVYDLSQGIYEINTLKDQKYFGPVQYGWEKFKVEPESFTFGGGLLAGSTLPGTRRMIFCGYSPQWEGFYVSALGGAMYVFRRTHLNYVCLHGKCPKTSILYIKYTNNQYEINLQPVEPEKIWTGYQDSSGKSWQNFYALQKYLFDTYEPMFPKDSIRILTVGPAAAHSNMGAIGSNHVTRGELTNIEDWAGRGGLGSQMLQVFNIAGVVFGGDWIDPEMNESKNLDNYFIERFGKKAVPTDIAFSEKYRYVPEFNTGGTFGVNMYQAEDRLFSFNYTSIYQSSEKRYAQNLNFIQDHYLKQFNDEIIKEKGFNHCGEPCAIVCKKFNDEFKKDYEPYEVFGPNCGIFDQRAAEKVNKYVDSLGIDAIQAGGMVDWIMELIWSEKLNPGDFNLSERKPKFGFASEDQEFDVVIDSLQNADFAIEILNMILFSTKGEPFRKGIRYASKWLDRNLAVNSLDSAVFTAHGENGCMVPNQYWVPGMFAPMPLMGKYFSYYGIDYQEPYKLGKKNVERFVYELYSENSGTCRFHRKWVEDIIDEIILSHFNLDFDYWKTNFELAKEIHNYQSQTSVFWESQRVVDIIYGYLKYWKEEGLNDNSLDEWLQKFQKDKNKAALEYWTLMCQGMDDAFRESFPEPTHVSK